MEYNSKSDDLIPKNMSGGLLTGFDDFNAETICRSADFVARHLVTPAVEATIQAYIQNCTPESERIISSKWSLCSLEHVFNCDSIYAYSSQCKSHREMSHCGYTTTTSKSSMERLMDDSEGVLLLVGLVVIGVLLGVASTVAVCLMCPNTHRWANSKLRNTSDYEKRMRESAVSDYYTAIDDRHNNATLQLRPVHSPSSNFPRTADMSQVRRPSTPRDFDDPNYVDPVTRDAHLQHSGAQPDSPEDSPRTNGPSETYEPLSRNDTNHLSHNYAHIDPTAPCSPRSPDDEHSYFVLEKST